MYIYIHIYICICIYIYISLSLCVCLSPQAHEALRFKQFLIPVALQHLWGAGFYNFSTLMVVGPLFFILREAEHLSLSGVKGGPRSFFA